MATTVGGSPAKLPLSSSYTVLHTFSHRLPLHFLLLSRPFSSSPSSSSSITSLFSRAPRFPARSRNPVFPSPGRDRRFSVRAEQSNGPGDAAAAPQRYDFDLFTIGAGSGGVRASRFAANYGASVAICELPFSTISSETTGGVGGTCVLRGCVPKKLLVYSSKYSHDFEESLGFGWNYEAEPKHDWSTLMANKNAELQRLTGIYKNILNNAGVQLIEGRGKIVDPHTVDVDGKLYSARHILISVGGRPFIPDIPGKEHTIDSDAALDLPSKPEKIAIVGGGYIALEFAGIFNGLKSDVHVFIRQKKVLRGFDEEVRDFVAEQMSLRGIEFHTEESPQAILKSADGSLSLKTNKGTIDRFSHVMFATGRRPNTKNLGLEEVGVKLSNNGAIEVDEYSRTSVDSIWAVGDVTNRVNLTPVALMEGGAFAKTVFGNEPIKPAYRYKNELKAFMYHNALREYIDKSNPDAQMDYLDVCHVVDDNKFWDRVSRYLKVVTPLVKILRMVDGDEKNDMRYLYEAMDRAKLELRASLPRHYAKWWKIIDQRWDNTLHHDLHAAGGLEVEPVDYVTGNTPLRAVPSAVFSQPPIGQVGLTEEQAIQEYGDIDVFTANFRPLKATLSGLPDRVFMKIIVCANTNRVLGVHMCGEDAPEIVQGIAIAVKAGLTKGDFDATVGVHPTTAEEFVTMRSPTRKIRRPQPPLEGKTDAEFKSPAKV